MSTQPTEKKSSNAYRYLYLFLIGLVVGGALTAVAIFQIQKGRDKFPESVMNVMARHSRDLRQTVERNRCAVTDTVPNLQTLRAMANDLESAFPGLADDKRFVQHASQLRARLDAALATPPTDCASANAMVKTLKDTCNACHQDFN
jgi:cytochrome c556